MLYVCPLAKLDQVVERVQASYLVSVVNPEMEVRRPRRIAKDNHLFLGLNDIGVSMPGFKLSSEQQVRILIDFFLKWDKAEPMVVHCWAGVSRSTASAYIAACALRPDLDEMQLARDLREASPPATPNKRLVELADRILQRDGRMIEAISSIGRGVDCYEGNVFAMPHI
ncbi:tyrosine protein phosphatase [uncultured Cohaesibacter sp.]|uniref:tyrosine phosphatase family protein n=1 Tax=uncultured Cohaesibacter sp. TaxID=1002546 RepID=UPI00292EBF56|nr:tyrosine protein phosphatase [uncultured Cohaesibacter sp.]